MADYVFKVEETSRGGYITYDAVEETSGLRVELGPMVVGEYPEIAKALAAEPAGFLGDLAYRERLGDKFEQGTQTWTFSRSGDKVTVIDMPRTVFRLESFR